MTTARPSIRTIIDSIGVALPTRRLSTQEVLDGCVNPVAVALEDTTGIATRRVVAADQFAFDLAVQAATDCLARSAIPAAAVDLLISTSISRMDAPNRVSTEPAAATRLRYLLGCTRARAFDITNACAGLFTGILVADALVRAGRIRTALVVSGEYITHLMRTAQLEIDGPDDPRLACLTLGDCGSAVLLTGRHDTAAGFEAIRMSTVGRHHRLCVAGPTDRPHGGAIMKTDTMGLAAVGIREMLAQTQDLLDRTGRPLNSFDWFIPHQTSTLAIQIAVRRAETLFGAATLGEDRVINNLRHRGNTSTTSHILALRDAIDSGRIRDRECVMFGIAASGVTVGAAAYHLDDLPSRLRGGARTQPATTAYPIHGRVPPVPVRPVGLGLSGPAGSTIDLLRAATARCLRRAGSRASDVELLIHTGVYRSGMIAEPAIAAIAAGEFGCDGSTTTHGRVFAFDLTCGAVGTLEALRVAAELLRAQRYANALVLSSEVEQRDDGAPWPIARSGSAMLLQTGSPDGPGFLDFRTEYPGTALDPFQAWGTQPGKCRTVIRSHQRVDLLRRCWPPAGPLVHRLVRQAHADPHRVRVIAAPAMPPDARRSLHHSLGPLADRLIHTSEPDLDDFTASIPRALDHLRRRHRYAPGDLAVLLCAGSGTHTGAALYRF